MEIEMQANNKDTLMHGLTAWNRIENMFREVFKEDSLKDRDYLKMKLAEYDRLHYRHEGSIHTTDERALMNMLRFQRRKMERSLYPGLLTRMLRRVIVYLSPPINAGREVAMARQAGMQPYLNAQLPVKGSEAQQQKDSPDEHQQRETKPEQPSGETKQQEKNTVTVNQKEQVSQRNWQWKKPESGNKKGPSLRG